MIWHSAWCNVRAVIAIEAQVRRKKEDLQLTCAKSGKNAEEDKSPTHQAPYLGGGTYVRQNTHDDAHEAPNQSESGKCCFQSIARFTFACIRMRGTSPARRNKDESSGGHEVYVQEGIARG
jgi:hypothetical protein